jgi:hypothetical protein
MIDSPDAKRLSTILRRNAAEVFGAVNLAFADAVVGKRREVDLLDALLSELSNRLESLMVPGVLFRCRSARLHQKPIVKTMHGSCELGDLMIVVKYLLRDATVECKSIIYQLKLSVARTSVYNVDRNQLALLKDWPPFEFGWKSDGNSRAYDIHPHTLEFGSYMLQPRNADPADRLRDWDRDVPLLMGPGSLQWERTYGVCPTAWHCAELGPSKINVERKSVALFPDADAFVSHICFQSGESHFNRPVGHLVEALYRYIGLSPDPPDEFDGFAGSENQDDGFAILEIIVDDQPHREKG